MSSTAESPRPKLLSLVLFATGITGLLLLALWGMLGLLTDFGYRAVPAMLVSLLLLQVVRGIEKRRESARRLAVWTALLATLIYLASADWAATAVSTDYFGIGDLFLFVGFPFPNAIIGFGIGGLTAAYLSSQGVRAYCSAEEDTVRPGGFLEQTSSSSASGMILRAVTLLLLAQLALILVGAAEMFLSS